MPTLTKTDEAKSPAPTADRHPGETSQAAAPSSEQRSDHPLERPAAAATPAAHLDQHVDQVKKPGGLRCFAPLLVLLIAAALLFAIIANWNAWVGKSGSQKTDD